MAEFNDHFRKYRLMAGFERLRDFSQALVEYGLNVDESTLSHYQRGSRIPKDRATLLVFIRVFKEREAITSPDDANLLLETAGFGYLTLSETTKLFGTPAETISERFGTTQSIQEVDLLSRYYIELLEQGETHPHSFYEVISEEQPRLESVIRGCYALHYSHRLLRIWDKFGTFLWDTGQWDLFETYAQKAVKSAQLLHKLPYQTFILLKQLSWLYYWQHETTKLTSTLKAAQQLLKENPDEYLQHVHDQLMAVANNQPAQLKTSFTYFKKNNHFLDAINSCLFLGCILSSKNEVALAEKEFKKALSLAQHHNVAHPKLHYYLGELLQKKQQVAAAFDHFQASLEDSKKMHKRAGAAWALAGMAMTSQHLQQKRYALQALDLFDELGMSDQARRMSKLVRSSK